MLAETYQTNGTSLPNLPERLWTFRLIESSGTSRSYKEEMSFWIVSQEIEVNIWKSKHEISWSWNLDQILGHVTVA